VFREVSIVLSNCNETLSRKEMLPKVRSLFQSDSNMADINVHAESPNKTSWRMSLLSCSLRLYLSQTSFGHISINSSMILMVSKATESP